jgi:uncharacterized protein
MERPLIIVGASTRAAAQSAIRAGFNPWMADQFADADLAMCGLVRRIENYPWELADIFRETPDAPWLYTGALENYPQLVEQLSSMRPLWGNSAEALRTVRDPLQLADALFSAGFDVPQVLGNLDKNDEHRQWLRKFKRSAGGKNVEQVQHFTANSQASVDGIYFQQRIHGQPISAVFIANGTTVNLLGITSQLIGDDGSGEAWCTADWTGAKGYWYAGSVGPITESACLADRATALGTFVANRFELRGLFGVDAILTADKIWPLEVNPRYTASIEVLERASGVRAIELHAEAFDRDPNAIGELCSDARNNRHTESDLQFGKSVLYATREITVSQGFPAFAAKLNESSAWPTLADIPPPGSVIPTGAPICTVFSEGSNSSDVIAGLRKRAKHVLATIASPPITAVP